AAKLAALVRDTLREPTHATSHGDAMAPPRAGVADPANLAGRTVLMVEDNAVNQMVCGEMLTELGVNYIVASNGIEALNKMQSASFDAVLMDCLMPEMDGYTATRELRRMMAAGEIRTTPIIALTANAMSDDRQKCLAAGMHDYVAKPVRAK